MIKNVAVVDLFYLPPIEFFVAIQETDEIRIEKQDNYQKQSYRNRAAIQMANKVSHLGIPVIGGNKKTKYKDVKIDEGQNWRNVHLRGMKSAYGKAPFFEYFYPDFEKIFRKDNQSLYDLNLELLTLCLKMLRSPVRITETLDYQNYPGEKDLRGVIKAKEGYEGRNIYEPFPYAQIFGLNFAPNLSVIDLLFCEGPNSKYVIACSNKK